MDINCFPFTIHIKEEVYGYNSKGHCHQGYDEKDCSVSDQSFYKLLCHDLTICKYLGVGWRTIRKGEGKCKDGAYTNYVHLVYQCVNTSCKYCVSVYSHFIVRCDFLYVILFLTLYGI